MQDVEPICHHLWSMVYAVAVVQQVDENGERTQQGQKNEEALNKQWKGMLEFYRSVVDLPLSNWRGSANIAYYMPSGMTDENALVCRVLTMLEELRLLSVAEKDERRSSIGFGAPASSSQEERQLPN